MTVPASPPSNAPRIGALASAWAPEDTPHDRAAEQLWRLWRDGQRPDVQSFLASSTLVTPDRLVAVLEVDQHERWRIGEVVPTEAYFQSFPVLGNDPRAFSLILGEMYLRQSGGEVISLEDYLRRFPAFEPQLALLSDPASATKSDASTDTANPVVPHAPVEPEPVKTLRLRPAWAAPSPIEDRSSNAQDASAEVLHAQRVGPYEIKGVLARGGMGVIYHAIDTQLKRSVALKMVIAGQHADPAALARFRGEAEAVARLQHPNIVQVFQVGEHDSLPYLALEFVEGQSLHQLLGGKALPPARAASLTRTLARAIDFAHQRGVIHRDIKPGNVLLDGDGAPKLTDFGLAKLHQERDTHTQPGEVIGTPNYMAPEQAEGTGEGVGPAADVYSLGAVLYEMLTGQPPFNGGSPMETLLRVRLSDPVRPSHYERCVPLDLETICLKCLRKDRHERYASAAALADDLDRYLHGKPILARPTSSTERAWKWTKRHPVSSMLAVALTLLIVVSYGLVLFHWRSAEEARLIMESNNLDLLLAREKLTAEKKRAEQAVERNDRLFYTQLLSSADRDWLMHDAAGAIQHLDACAAGQRGWEWNLLRRQVEGAQLTIPAPPGTLAALTVLPGDREFAGLSADGTLHFWKMATGQPVRDLPLQRGRDFPLRCNVSRGVFSPDGQFVAAVGQPPGGATAKSRVGVWRTSGGELVQAWECSAGVPIRLAFCPETKRLAWTSGVWQEKRGLSEWTHGEVRVLNLADGATRLHFDSGEHSFADVAFSPDGRRLALTGRATALLVCDAQTGDVLVREDNAGFRGHGVIYLSAGRDILVQHEHEVALFSSAGVRKAPLSSRQGSIDRVFASADGSRLALADVQHTIRVWNATTRQELLQLVGHTQSVTLATFTADNSRLITHGLDGRLKVWDLRKEPGPLALDGGDIAPEEWIPSAVFDRAGERLFTASDEKKIRVFDPSTGERLFVLQASDKVRSLALSPDGRRLAVGHDTPAGRIAIWDLATRTETIWPAGHRDDVICVAYSADGQRLASASEDGTARVWEAATGRLLFQMTGHSSQVNYVAFHPDGRQIVTAGADGTVRFWADGGALIRTLNAHDTAVSCVVFSPDGRQMATANHNRDKPAAATQIRLWDCASGEMLHTLTGHAMSIWHLAYSPDGTRLASAGEDHTVKIWDPEHGELRLSLKWHDDDVRCVVFSPDGRFLVSCGDDPFIRVWDAAPLKQP